MDTFNVRKLSALLLKPQIEVVISLITDIQPGLLRVTSHNFGQLKKVRYPGDLSLADFAYADGEITTVQLTFCRVSYSRIGWMSTLLMFYFAGFKLCTIKFVFESMLEGFYEGAVFILLPLNCFQDDCPFWIQQSSHHLF